MAARRRSLLVSALVAAVTVSARAGGARRRGRRQGARARAVPRRRGRLGDPYYPLYGNGGYDVGHYGLVLTYQPSTDRPHRRRNHLGGRDGEPVPVQPRPAGSDGALGPGRRASGPAATRTDDHELRHHAAARSSRRARPSVTVVRYDGVPRTVLIPGFDPPLEAGFIHTDDGRGRRGPAGGRRQLVPRQRPPARPGDLHVHRDGAGRPRGHRERRPGRATPPSRTAHHVDLERDRADGVLPRDGQRRGVRPAAIYDLPERHHDVRRGGPRPLHRVDRRLRPGAPTFGQVIDQSFARHGAILDFLADTFGPYPFTTGGGERRRLRRPVLRAGEPDAHRLLEVLLLRHVRRGRRHRPRERPPVVRGQRRRRAVEGHLAERGLRDVRRVALGRPRRAVHASRRPSTSTTTTRSRRTTPSGRSSSRTRASTTCSTTRSTTGAP